MADEQPRKPRGRPSKLTPELKELILTAIREGGCTYADCLPQGGHRHKHATAWGRNNGGPRARRRDRSERGLGGQAHTAPRWTSCTNFSNLPPDTLIASSIRLIGANSRMRC